MKQFLFFIFFILILNSSYGQSYRNPVISGFNPDPSVCRVGDDFYLVTSSFGYFPGVPVYHSKDLINWKHINYCLKTEKQLRLHETSIQAGVWAPTLRYHKGTFYMVTTCNRKNFYVTTKDPHGDWSDPVFLDIEGYDPSFLFANDSLYLTWANQNAVFQCVIDPETGELITPSKNIFHKGSFHGTEGPHVYQIGGYYYLSVAHDGTDLGHRQSFFRSTSVWGPWEDHPENPVLKNYLNRLTIVQATGHADIVEARDGSWWMVHLGIRNFGGMTEQFANLGRETFLMPLNWEADWPVVYNNGYSKQLVSAKTLTPHHQTLYLTNTDAFDKDTLNLYWNLNQNMPTKKPASRFLWTGMFLGMYATGNGKKVKNPAFFDYFRYTNQETEKEYQKNLWE